MISPGRIFVISAPSGSGKTTLCKRLLKRCPNLVFSKSLTTRKLRRGEKNRRDYIFVSQKKFQEYRRARKLLEWAKVFDNLYGTPKDFVEKTIRRGRDVVLVIDVQGAFQVKKARPDAILIFVMPPSLRELQRRLSKRKSDGPSEIALRLKIARREMARRKDYDYIVVNDKINRALKELGRIVSRKT